MRLFTCDSCEQIVHFDNRYCVRCNHRLGFLPEELSMRALEPHDEMRWQPVASPERRVRFCANAGLDICNWLLTDDDAHEFCAACRHNRLVPNTGTADGVARWRLISQAQRHLFYAEDLQTDWPVDPAQIGAISPEKVRQFELAGDAFTVTYLDAASKPTAVAVWRRTAR